MDRSDGRGSSGSRRIGWLHCFEDEIGQTSQKESSEWIRVAKGLDSFADLEEREVSEKLCQPSKRGLLAFISTDHGFKHEALGPESGGCAIYCGASADSM